MLGVANANSEEKNNYLACGPDLPRRAPRASHPAGPTPTPPSPFAGRPGALGLAGASVPRWAGLQCLFFWSAKKKSPPSLQKADPARPNALSPTPNPSLARPHCHTAVWSCA